MFASKDTLLTRPSGYTIARSVRLRSSASAYFNRTLGSGNAQKFTLSMWCKLSQNNAGGFLFDAYSSGTVRSLFQLDNSTGTTIQFYSGNGTVTQYFTTNQVFRDPSAWYHLVFKVDTTASTNGIVLYVNGVATSLTWNNTLAQNTNLIFNTAVAHNIGKYGGGAAYFDGYLTEINFIDGQALTPSSFGETDSITGVWKAKKYGGTYGTNGFYLNFSDNSNNTATTIGKDYSGNGNNWTPNNISVTAGSTYDSMVDSPTVSAVSSNYCVVNPLDKGGGVTITDGNLTLTRASSLLDWDTARCTIQVPSTGKYYWELTLVSGSNDGCLVGVGTATADLSQEVNGFWAYQSAGYIIYNGSYTTATALSVGDVVMIAFDRTNNKLWFGRNGTWGLNGGTPVTPTDPNSNFTSLPSDLFPAVGIRYTANSAINFGQRPFTYTPPTGFVALNTYNLPASTITNGAAYMAATTYTGDSASPKSFSNAVNGVSFQPDFVWIKNRSNAYFHNLYDSVRGTGSTKNLISNGTYTEGDSGYAGLYGFLSAFNSNGFQTTNGTDGAGPSIWVNQSSQTYVAWQWKAGGTAVSNTNGSITSTVSANTTAGFSVVTYTGTGANATVGHGLGVAPSLIIVKKRSGANAWFVGATPAGWNKYLLLNTTDASATDPGTVWQATAPTSSVFYLGTTGEVNANTATFVAYCFSAVAGYSAFGSYTGNGSADGPFVFTGFRPRWLMTKRTDSSVSGDWNLVDTSRGTYNAVGPYLYANQSAAEGNAAIYDILSNGFKIRETGSGTNANGGTYIYACFAENPFRNALAR